MWRLVLIDGRATATSEMSAASRKMAADRTSRTAHARALRPDVGDWVNGGLDKRLLPGSGILASVRADANVRGKYGIRITRTDRRAGETLGGQRARAALLRGPGPASERTQQLRSAVLPGPRRGEGPVPARHVRGGTHQSQYRRVASVPRHRPLHRRAA